LLLLLLLLPLLLQILHFCFLLCILLLLLLLLQLLLQLLPLKGVTADELNALLQQVALLHQLLDQGLLSHA
jgi:hypothetical protein